MCCICVLQRELNGGGLCKSSIEEVVIGLFGVELGYDAVL